MSIKNTIVLDIDASGRDLAESALAICRDEGLFALTFRSLATRADVSVATLQSRFGAKEGLLKLAFAAAVDAETRQLDRMADMLDPVDISPTAALSLYRSFVQDLTSHASASQLMLLEMLVTNIREPSVGVYVKAWLDRVQRFWSEACRFHKNHEELGWFLTELQISLLLTTLCCHRSVETALANDDLIEHAIGGNTNCEAVWYPVLLTKAIDVERTLPTDRSVQTEILDRLLIAGAEVVAAQGASALSYRSVASRAGVSLSAVTHYFPKRQSLIYAVYRRIYEETAFDSIVAVSNASLRDSKSITQHYVDLILRRKFAGVCQPVAHAELYLLAARQPSLADLAWHMRMTRGLYWMGKAHPAFNPASPESFDTHAKAIWMLGCALVHMAYNQETGLEKALQRSISFGIALFDRTSALAANP